MRRFIGIAAALIGVGLMASPVAAQTVTTTTIPGSSSTTLAPKTTIPGGITVDGALTLTPATTPVAPGVKVAVSAAGVTPGSATMHLVSATNVGGLQLGTVTVPATGMLTANITIPTDAAAGTWYVRVVDAGAKVFATSITVNGGVTTGTPTTTVAVPGALPNNGPLATFPMIVGAAMIGFAGFVFSQRTRRA